MSEFTNSPASTNKVTCGVNKFEGMLAGRTVGWVRNTLGDTLVIPADSKAHVGSTQVEDSHVIQQGAPLEFRRESGVKGGFALTSL